MIDSVKSPDLLETETYKYYIKMMLHHVDMAKKHHPETSKRHKRAQGSHVKAWNAYQGAARMFAKTGREMIDRVSLGLYTDDANVDSKIAFSKKFQGVA